MLVNPIVSDVLEAKPADPEASRAEERQVAATARRWLGTLRGPIVALLFGAALLVPAAAVSARGSRREGYALRLAREGFRWSRLLVFLSAATTAVGWVGWRWSLYADLGESYIAALVLAVATSALSLKRCDPTANVRNELLASLAWLSISCTVFLL
jgi:hypothetical protein